VPEAAPLLVFEALPSRQLLTRGEAVVLVLYLRNLSEQPIFVSRLQGDELVNFDVTGPDGKEVPWRGSARTNSKKAAPSNFVVLDKYREISVKRTISLKDGAGFIFDKPGQYSVTGEYSLGPSERLAPFAAGTKIPTGTFRSAKAAFCIEACVLGSVAGQNGAILSELSQPHTNAPKPRSTRCVSSTPTSSIPAAWVPGGRARKALWPLMSNRLVHELDRLQVCDDDYYRRYGAILQVNTYKPATPWLEVGLVLGTKRSGRSHEILDPRQQSYRKQSGGCSPQVHSQTDLLLRPPHFIRPR